MKKADVAIVGMGISGLKTAYDLLLNSSHLISSISFYEKTSQIGGVLNHTIEEKFILEHGAQGVLLSRESFSKCVHSLNLEENLVIAPKDKQTRYVIFNKKCIAVSPNIFLLIKEGILNIMFIFKLIQEFFFKKYQPIYLNETIYDFFSRHFGKVFADNFIIPLSFGIWGGASRSLLIRHCFPNLQTAEYNHGSLIKTILYSFLKKNKKKDLRLASFTNGMNCLPKTIFSEIEILCIKNKIKLNTFFNTQLNFINYDENLKKIKLKFQPSITSSQESFAEFDIVIYSGQPWRDKNLNIGSKPKQQEALQILKHIPSHNIIVVGLGGEKLPHFSYKDGLGALANKDSKGLLGILFVHSIYKEHCPHGNFLYRILLGGEKYSYIQSLMDNELIEYALNHLKDLNLLHGDEKLTFQKIIRWPQYIPLATEYQEKVYGAVWQLEALTPGLFFAGNFIKGVSVADCLEQAEHTSLKAKIFLQTQL